MYMHVEQVTKTHREGFARSRQDHRADVLLTVPDLRHSILEISTQRDLLLCTYIELMS